VRDVCRGVNLQPDDSQTAIEQMKAAGVRIIDSGDIYSTNQTAPQRPTDHLR
jgi:hypothetical protein